MSIVTNIRNNLFKLSTNISKSLAGRSTEDRLLCKRRNCVSPSTLFLTFSKGNDVRRREIMGFFSSLARGSGFKSQPVHVRYLNLGSRSAERSSLAAQRSKTSLQQSIRSIQHQSCFFLSFGCGLVYSAVSSLPEPYPEIPAVMLCWLALDVFCSEFLF